MIKRLILNSARLLPEGGLKHFVRSTILGFRIAAPREFMINRGDTVVQVGMWRRTSAKRVLDAIGPDGTALFIEVSAKSIEDLKKAHEESNCKNVFFVNKGAWDSPGEIELLIEDNPANTRLQTGMLHPGELGKAQTQKVQVDTIENICNSVGINKIDYIEITVNGAEVNALKGMGDLVKVTKRFWVAGLTRNPETNQPLNIPISEYLQSRGVKTKISTSGKKATDKWGRLDGHVYGWQ